MIPVRSAFPKVLMRLRVAVEVTGLLAWAELGKLLVGMLGGRVAPQVEVDSREMTLAVSPLGVVIPVALALLGCMSDVTLSLECLIRGSHGDGNEDWY